MTSAATSACLKISEASSYAYKPAEYLYAQTCIDIDELCAHVPVYQRKLRAGQYLYHAGQIFGALYLVHAGCVKTCLISEDGREQVIGFRMRGELLGSESIGLKTYACDVVALDESEIWEMPYPAVRQACANIPELQAQLASAVAAEIRTDQSWMLALGTLNAEQRVAAFLLDIAGRHATLGLDPSCFVLRMSRAEIGSFLTLKHETVTRALTSLGEQGCITVRWREVRVLNSQRLNDIVHAARD